MALDQVPAAGVSLAVAEVSLLVEVDEAKAHPEAAEAFLSLAEAEAVLRMEDEAGLMAEAGGADQADLLGEGEADLLAEAEALPAVRAEECQLHHVSFPLYSSVLDNSD